MLVQHVWRTSKPQRLSNVAEVQIQGRSDTCQTQTCKWHGCLERFFLRRISTWTQALWNIWATCVAAEPSFWRRLCPVSEMFRYASCTLVQHCFWSVNGTWEQNIFTYIPDACLHATSWLSALACAYVVHVATSKPLTQRSGYVQFLLGLLRRCILAMIEFWQVRECYACLTIFFVALSPKLSNQQPT